MKRGEASTKQARADEAPLLRVRDLTVTFETEAGTVHATDRVSFDIYPGETLAVVGESGSGKSVTAMSIMRLIDRRRGKVERGSVLFEGRDLLAAPDSEVRAVRGNRIGMIFQEPMSSLNPVYTLGTQIGEPLILHKGFSAEQARAEAIHLLGLVGMPSPERRVDEYRAACGNGR
jgi:ABC-type microcin C transport system duplicated ATPase subunit YejF